MGCADAVGVGRAILPTRTRIGGHHELEARRELSDRVRSVDGDYPGLERLAQCVEGRRLKLGSLIEEQDAVRGPRRGTGTDDATAAAHQGCRRRGVMGRLERRAHRETRTDREARKRADRAHLQRILGPEIGQEAGKPGGEHRLSGAGRPEQEEMVSSRRGNGERLDGILVAHYVGEVEPVVHRIVDAGGFDRVDHDRLEFAAVPDRGIPQ